MSEYILLIMKCIFFYFVIIIALRFMGKREVGELSIFDLVIYLVMSELLALSLSEGYDAILKTLVPLITLACLQILVATLILKSSKLRYLIDGEPVILIRYGQIDQQAMKKERYNIDDLMLQLRNNGVGTPQEVAFALLESNGKLSVLKMNDNKMKYPIPLIQDGELDRSLLPYVKLEEKDLIKAMKQQGIDQIEDVFLCLYQKNGFYFLKHSSLTSQTLQ